VYAHLCRAARWRGGGAIVVVPTTNGDLSLLSLVGGVGGVGGGRVRVAVGRVGVGGGVGGGVIYFNARLQQLCCGGGAGRGGAAP
jgi:hypothetical protein